MRWFLKDFPSFLSFHLFFSHRQLSGLLVSLSISLAKLLGLNKSRRSAIKRLFSLFNQSIKGIPGRQDSPVSHMFPCFSSPEIHQLVLPAITHRLCQSLVKTKKLKTEINTQQFYTHLTQDTREEHVHSSLI